jgi:divalent metal cation (Fe/Co/Zn/Cd) transporter
VELRRALPQLAGVVTHIEPAGEGLVTKAGTAEEAVIRQTLQALAADSDLAFVPHSVEVGSLDGRPSLSFHLWFDAAAPITDAHALTEAIEHELRGRLPDLGRVTIHVEPERIAQEPIG